MNIHDIIKKQREKQGVTKYKMAKLLGTSQGYYANLEKGEFKPSFDRIFDICKILNITITISPDGVKIK
jgi:transcriptional regulator with XRE-family HTH domain